MWQADELKYLAMRGCEHMAGLVVSHLRRLARRHLRRSIHSHDWAYGPTLVASEVFNLRELKLTLKVNA